jgi:hypothetical protein
VRHRRSARPWLGSSAPAPLAAAAPLTTAATGVSIGTAQPARPARTINAVRPAATSGSSGTAPPALYLLPTLTVRLRATSRLTAWHRLPLSCAAVR